MYERRVGAFLVHAAWERWPEGPAYLLSFVMLLYLAGQCAFFCTRSPPWISGTRRGFFPSSYDSGPASSDCLQIRERSSGPELLAPKSIFLPFLWRYQSSPPPASKTFMFFGCGWWYDREIVLLPPLCEYRERLRETTRQLFLRAAEQQTGASPVAPSRPWR